MSTVPIFKVPCARTATGRTSRETSVKESIFFIEGLNKSSETAPTASANIRLKLVADAEVQMAVFGVACLINRDAVIKSQRSDGKVEPDADTEVGREGIERSFRPLHE